MSIKLHRLLVPINEVQVKELTGLDAYRLPDGDIAYLNQSDAVVYSGELVPTLLRVSSELIRLEQNNLVAEAALYEWAKHQVVDTIEEYEDTNGLIINPEAGDFAIPINKGHFDAYGIVKVLDTTGVSGSDVKTVGATGIEFFHLGSLTKVETVNGGIVLSSDDDKSTPIVLAH